ncbi:hypothetical protein [Bradyrhizobium sp. BR 10289]|uniref:hypothetical protein n=1 Tax=Bradyrhizobium sp. BR 10289 TaxID=2749993 RepID=UPI001C64D600|nr:hypothetical protein [Bradyrhizobium sp. BR 10289]MBW7971196.1 hypothetical protein [Bradyrhizobium sp. BR 10289]
MGRSDGDDEQATGPPGEPAAPSDLIDFYRRWRDFRPAAIGLARRSDMSVLEQQTIRWLILLVDRISEQDLR